jgi:hypothetical protein
MIYVSNDYELNLGESENKSGFVLCTELCRYILLKDGRS